VGIQIIVPSRLLGGSAPWFNDQETDGGSGHRI
jgi:hypothetical protein